MIHHRMLTNQFLNLTRSLWSIRISSHEQTRNSCFDLSMSIFRSVGFRAANYTTSMVLLYHTSARAPVSFATRDCRVSDPGWVMRCRNVLYHCSTQSSYLQRVQFYWPDSVLDFLKPDPPLHASLGFAVSVSQIGVGGKLKAFMLSEVNKLDTTSDRFRGFCFNSKYRHFWQYWKTECMS